MTLSSTAALAGPKSRFGQALLVAFLIEIGAIAALMIVPLRQPPREIRPATMAIYMIKPIGPPKRLLPPKPAQPRKPPIPVPALPKPPPLTDHPHIAVPRRASPPHPVQRAVHQPVSQPPQPAPIQAPLAPQVSAPPPSPAQVQTAEARYVGIIRGIILDHINVPQSLRNLGASGRAMVEFDVAPDGRIMWVRLIRKSGYADANQAARQAVQDSTFPHFLQKMPQHDIIFEIPVYVDGDS